VRLNASLPVRQIAYFCADAREAARRHSELFGSGPYFLAENIPLARAVYRGADADLDHTSAYGQWGDVMIEFVQQNNRGDSAFHDLYPEGSGKYGLHHIALFADDAELEVKKWSERGFQAVFKGVMADGFTFFFIDTVEMNGHMVEIYEDEPRLVGFYDYVRKAAENWDGSDVVRTIRLG
jgi:catechol 2,3-dioxygenase-like lactoylglutathione lyase family enzyme